MESLVLIAAAALGFFIWQFAVRPRAPAIRVGEWRLSAQNAVIEIQDVSGCAVWSCPVDELFFGYNNYKEERTKTVGASSTTSVMINTFPHGGAIATATTSHTRGGSYEVEGSARSAVFFIKLDQHRVNSRLLCHPPIPNVGLERDLRQSFRLDRTSSDFVMDLSRGQQRVLRRWLRQHGVLLTTEPQSYVRNFHEKIDNLLQVMRSRFGYRVGDLDYLHVLPSLKARSYARLDQSGVLTVCDIEINNCTSWPAGDTQLVKITAHNPRDEIWYAKWHKLDSGQETRIYLSKMLFEEIEKCVTKQGRSAKRLDVY